MENASTSCESLKRIRLEAGNRQKKEQEDVMSLKRNLIIQRVREKKSTDTPEKQSDDVRVVASALDAIYCNSPKSSRSTRIAENLNGWFTYKQVKTNQDNTLHFTAKQKKETSIKT